jgi:hypothetical protein
MFAQLATHADWESRLHSICDPARLAAARVSCSVNLGKFDYYPAVGMYSGSWECQAGPLSQF